MRQEKKIAPNQSMRASLVSLPVVFFFFFLNVCALLRSVVSPPAPSRHCRFALRGGFTRRPSICDSPHIHPPILRLNSHVF